jgi:hypothetical protein
MYLQNVKVPENVFDVGCIGGWMKAAGFYLSFLGLLVSTVMLL